MFVRLEKIDSEQRQNRFYAMYVARTLFGEWCLVREWGRIGAAGGRRLTEYTASESDAHEALDKRLREKKRRGYRLSAA
ncbi:MAG: WGR domain-containing protein [Pseudomonadota bacterium]